MLATGIAGALVRNTPEAADASGSSYQFELTTDDGVEYVGIDILNSAHLSNGEEDYSAYKTESDLRIAGWVASPSSAPVINGHPVAVTFDHPLSAAVVSNLATSVNFEIYETTTVSNLSTGERAASIFPGPIDVSYIDDLIASGAIPNEICQGSSAHEGCYTSQTTGIMVVVGVFTSDGLNGLDSLRNHADVYLADSTAIDYITDHPTSTERYVMLPNAMWSNSPAVSWP